MGKVYFLFGVHNHQPVGNFHRIFKDAYEHCYFPFISLLEKFPKIKFSLHNSGCLYDWLLEHRKEYLKILKKLVKRGQVEIISGGYYEPILPLVSDEDKAGQIELMNDFIKREFGQAPKGLWLAERVWEPSLARHIHDCALEYTFLDDTHFRYAGYREKEFFGYYTTEDQARPIYIFPISRLLRYKIPFSQAEEAVAILNSFAQEKDVLVTLFDDGEKFGLWPHTYEWVYEKEWLKKFLSLLEQSPNIKTVTCAQAIAKFSSNGIIYLPTASYEEMGEWVLEPQSYFVYAELLKFLKEQNRFEQFKDFIRGGFFKNFYRKYNRLNYMHKRMLYLSKKINSQVDIKKDKDILLNLWKAQTNCSYWHGIFGGFYLGHIRGAVFSHLIQAENLWDKKYQDKTPESTEEDIDLDGRKEIVFKNEKLICCFSRKGGTLLELSLRKPATNLVNTITRREESYHQKLRENTAKQGAVVSIHNIIASKEAGLDKLLIYDQYERLALVDHLLNKDLTLDDFNAQKGIDTLSDRIYHAQVKKDKTGISLNFHYHEQKLDFQKIISFSALSGLDLLYEFQKKNLLNFSNFGVEFNLFLPSLEDIFKGQKKDKLPLNQPQAWKDETSLTIIDLVQNIGLEFEFNQADIFSLPVYSVSSSESGFEKTYQQLALLFIFKNKKDELKLSLRINPLEKK